MVKKIVSKVIVIEEWCIIVQINSWEIQFSGHCSKLMYKGKENCEGYRRKFKEKKNIWRCLKEAVKLSLEIYVWMVWWQILR